MAPCAHQPRSVVMDATAPEAFGITVHLDRVPAFWHNATRNMEATRYFIVEDIRALGIVDEVLRLFGNIGWTSFFMSSRDTHWGPTLEFLTTLKLDYHESKGTQSITFSAGGKEYDLSTLDINRAMDAPLTGVYLKHDEFTTMTIRPLIVAPDTSHFQSGVSKTSEVRNPVFRFILRFLTYSLFARKENSHCQDSELLVMWCMLTSRTVDLSKHLLAQLHRQTNTDRGDIVIGALCTALINIINPEFQFGESLPLTTMDLQTLVNMHLIKTKQPPY